jgi:hypothetical protein
MRAADAFREKNMNRLCRIALAACLALAARLRGRHGVADGDQALRSSERR